MDSPMFASDRDGQAMVADEQLRRLEVEHGIPSAVRPGLGLPHVRRRWSRRLAVSVSAARFVPSRGPLAWRLGRQVARLHAAARAGGVRRVGRAMIVLFNPVSTTPGKQPLPLSVLSLAAVLEGRDDWTLVDGNVVADPAAADHRAGVVGASSAPALLAVTVMPGPQLTQAVEVCRRSRRALPDVPIVWGGYFPTQHAETVLRSSFVDFVVRSQGERPLLQLLDALAAGRAARLPSRPLVEVGRRPDRAEPDGCR